MTVSAGNTENASETYDAKKINSNKNQVLREVVETRIRANLEPLNQQILNITQLLAQLIQDNSGKTTPMVASRTHCPQTGSSFNSETGASKTSPDIAIGSRGFSPNSDALKITGEIIDKAQTIQTFSIHVF